MVEARDVVPVEGYDPELGLLLASLDDGTREGRQELGELDEDGLVSRPFEGGPSVGALLLHIAAVEASWIRRAIGGREFTHELWRRLRGDETDVDAGRWPEAPRMPLADYYALLDEMRQESRDTLRGERPERLVQENPQWTGETVRWIVGHAVQHEAYHLGQAVMVKRMVKGAMG